MACRCAGADNPDEFWQLLRQGRDCIERVTDQRWLDFFAQHSITPVPAKYGQMQSQRYFDAAFFGISQEEAGAMDLPQRILLEDTYHALEDAGIRPESLHKQSVGIFIGSVGGGSQARDLSEKSLLGTDTSVLSARLAFFLDLKGPALTVNTACSSSLVALDVAYQYLRSGKIDLAIVAGITIYTDPGAFLMMNSAGMLSADELCCPFDNRANGMVVGDGSGVLILKNLDDAEQNHDPVHGVIAAIGTNQNGQTAGMTVPSYLSQSQLQTSLYQAHNIDVEAIQYIETHGTATKLGDPIEIDGLKHTFSQFTERKNYCALGSVKANIGHTTAASGVLSIIKVLLSFRAKHIPASLNFSEPNEHIDFTDSPFFVNTELREWPDNHGEPRMAAITSLGHSGTNAHLVLQEYQPSESLVVKPADVRKEVLTAGILIPLSAKSPASLTAYVHKLIAFLSQSHTPELHDIAYTLQTGRDNWRQRIVFQVATVAELSEQLQWFAGASEQERTKAAAQYYWQGTVSKRQQQPEFGHIQVADSTVLAQLASYWVQGGELDWASLWYSPTYKSERGDTWPLIYPEHQPRRVHLPVYVFEHESDNHQHGLNPLQTVTNPVTGSNAHRSIAPISPADMEVSDYQSNGHVATTPSQHENRCADFHSNGNALFDVMPEQGVEMLLQTILAHQLSCSTEQIDTSVNYFHLGLNSLGVVNLLAALKRITSEKVGAGVLFEYNTVALLAEYLQVTYPKRFTDFSYSEYLGLAQQVSTSQPLSAYPELILLNQQSSLRPVFWFHGGLGGVQPYHVLAEVCERPFYGIQARGWMTQHDPIRGVQAMAAYYISMIQAAQPSGPYDLGGYSLGGLLAYEVARQLQMSGESVTSIVMLDTFDSRTTGDIQHSLKNDYLQAVNIALQTQLMKSPDTFTQALIHKDQLDLKLADDAFLDELIRLAQQRGAFINDNNIKLLVKKQAAAQTAHAAHLYGIPPLMRPDEIRCYYVKNSSGVYMGELEPYFLAEGDQYDFDHKKHWEIWQERLPDFSVLEVNASNHLVLLAEDEACTAIRQLCQKLYAGNKERV